MTDMTLQRDKIDKKVKINKKKLYALNLKGEMYSLSKKTKYIYRGKIHHPTADNIEYKFSIWKIREHNGVYWDYFYNWK